jgi:outer membrane receptor protein involved in Fe transport
VRTVTLDRNFNPIAPIQYFPKFFGWGQEQLSRLTRRRTTVLGGLLRHQAAFMNGRLLTYAGLRFDAVRFREHDYLTVIPGVPNGGLIRKTIDQLKPNLGANYKLTQNLRVFANYSESYFVNQTDNPNVFADPAYKPEIANGYDYGFKGSFFEDRLTFTVSGFYAIRENVSVSNTFERPLGSGNFVTENQRAGNQLVRGYEMDLNWQASDAVSVTGSWGHVYSIFTDFGTAAPLAVGRRVNGVTPQNGSLSVRYGPRTGILKNFSANLGVTHMASTPTELPNAGDTYITTPSGQRVLDRTTYQWRLRVPSATLWNLGARYTFKQGRIDQTLAINVNNIFDRDYLKVNRQLGERRAVYFTYTLGYAGTR